MSVSCFGLATRAAQGALVASMIFTCMMMSLGSARAADPPRPKNPPRTVSPKFPIKPIVVGNDVPTIDPGRGNRNGPITRVPGLGGGIQVKPRLPGLTPGNVVVDNVNVPVATAIVQVLNTNHQWSSSRTIVVPKQTKFRWSTTSNQAVSARWELFLPNAVPQPPSGGGHQTPHGGTAILMAYGDLSIPPLGAKQEFSVDMAKHLAFAAPANGAEYKLRIVVYDAAKKQIAPGSNHVTLKYLPLQVQIGNYERFKGNFQANEPAVDAFIRATITNTSSAPIEQGARFEFYAKKGNAAPVKIGDGIVPAISPGGQTTVIATRPVEDWHKSDAQSQYSYECKVFAVKP